jgi:hypothetical protein
MIFHFIIAKPLGCKDAVDLCQNGGSCFDIDYDESMEKLYFSFNCSCKDGYYGELCEKSKLI